MKILKISALCIVISAIHSVALAQLQIQPLRQLSDTPAYQQQQGAMRRQQEEQQRQQQLQQQQELIRQQQQMQMQLQQMQQQMQRR
jgi:hypothetical protein